jgi:hypothetical protein
MININSLVFPIVAFKQNENYLYSFLRKKKITKTSVRLYEKGIYDNAFFIDSRGYLFEVKSIERVRWGTFLLGYSLMYKGRLINIEFNLEMLGKLSLEEFKEFIYPKVKTSLPDFVEVEDDFKSAKNYAEVIQVIK